MRYDGVAVARDEVRRFRTFGFLRYPQILSSPEIDALSAAFDTAMARAEVVAQFEKSKRSPGPADRGS